MPRAKRYHIPGYVWHLTHRCHKRDYLLKFARDRSRWVHWLFEAKKRYGISILNYSVTCNHVHLLLFDSGEGKSIARSMQLIAGRTAQEFNLRKNRQGAFWKDRYHATAVESGEHLRQCIVYIDMNMVRAGAVRHPDEWAHCGYNEIQMPKQRYRLIDQQKLCLLTGFDTLDRFKAAHKAWVDDAIGNKNLQREDRWTESVAVGKREFVAQIKQRLRQRARGRRIVETKDGAELKESLSVYNTDFKDKNEALSIKNAHFFEENNMFSSS